jgi:hypothetical protein
MQYDGNKQKKKLERGFRGERGVGGEGPVAGLEPVKRDGIRGM